MVSDRKLCGAKPYGRFQKRPHSPATSLTQEVTHAPLRFPVTLRSHLCHDHVSERFNQRRGVGPSEYRSPRHSPHRTLNPRLVSQTTPYGVAS